METEEKRTIRERILWKYHHWNCKENIIFQIIIMRNNMFLLQGKKKKKKRREIN